MLGQPQTRTAHRHARGRPALTARQRITLRASGHSQRSRAVAARRAASTQRRRSSEASGRPNPIAAADGWPMPPAPRGLHEGKRPTQPTPAIAPDQGHNSRTTVADDRVVDEALARDTPAGGRMRSFNGPPANACVWANSTASRGRLPEKSGRAFCGKALVRRGRFWRPAGRRSSWCADGVACACCHAIAGTAPTARGELVGRIEHCPDDHRRVRRMVGSAPGGMGQARTWTRRETGRTTRRRRANRRLGPAWDLCALSGLGGRVRRQDRPARSWRATPTASFRRCGRTLGSFLLVRDPTYQSGWGSSGRSRSDASAQVRRGHRHTRSAAYPSHRAIPKPSSRVASRRGIRRSGHRPSSTRRSRPAGGNREKSR